MKPETKIENDAVTYNLLANKHLKDIQNDSCPRKLSDLSAKLSDSNSNQATNYIHKKLKMFSSNLSKPSYLRAGFYAQVVSLLVCCTGIINSELDGTYDINIPTAQSVFNYILLACTFTPIWFYKNKTEFKSIIKAHWWKYLLLALADVEANYLIIKAYSLTIVTTIQVIDAFVLPITLLLSYIFLKLRYKSNNILGVICCLAGCSLIVTADYLVHINDPDSNAKHRVSGDLLCFMASILYAVSNVGSEMFVKDNSKLEYLSMIGVFGTLISLVQMFIAERSEISQLLGSDNISIWALFLLESLVMFLIYSIIPCILQISSAAFLNVNLLTSDFYSVLVGIFFRKYELHFLYFVGLGCIFFGTILYSISKPRHSQDDATVSNEEESKVEMHNKNVLRV